MKPMPSREDQIKIMTGAKGRAEAVVQRWLDDPEVKAFLHHSDPVIRERAMTGFFAVLTPEQQARALAYRGPDGFGEQDHGF